MTDPTDHRPEPTPAPPDSAAESPLAPFYRSLDAGFQTALDKTRERARDLQQTVSEETGQVVSQLRTIRDKLDQAFPAEGGGPPPGEKELARLAEMVESQGALVFRKLRPAMDRLMKTLGSRRGPAISALELASRVYTESARLLPEAAPPPNPELATRLARLPGAGYLLDLLEVSPRQLFAEILPEREAQADQPLARSFAAAQAKAGDQLADTWRGLRFHFGLAVEEIRDLVPDSAADETPADPAKTLAECRVLLLETCTDAEEKLASAATTLQETLQALPAALEEGHALFLDKVRDEFQETRRWRSLQRHYQRLLREVVASWREKAATLIEQGKEEVSRSAAGLSQGANLLRNVQALLGKGGGVQETLLALTDLPDSEALNRQVGALPRLYQRLFTLGPLRNREFLVAREEELDDLDAIFQRWQENKACSVAIIGPEGSGKTSLLNSFASEYGARGQLLELALDFRLQQEEDLLRIFARWLDDEEPLPSLDQLPTRVLREPRRVVIVEGGHNLGLRTIGGYRMARAFLQLVMTTRRHWLWIISFRKYPWQLLDHQLGLGQFFTHQIRTLFHDQEELQEAILLRQRTSGLELNFLAGESPLSEPRAAATQEQLKQRFFRDLLDSTSGNIDAAIYYWLLHLDWEATTKVLQVRPLEKLDFGFLRALGRDNLFALAEVLNHGTLTGSEFAAIFRRSPEEASFTMESLAHLNLLRVENTGNGQRRYQLNPVFFGPVATTLESMNILH